MAKTLIVASPHGEFEKGAELTRGPAIAAYLMGVLNLLTDKETTLSPAEMQRTFKATDTDGLDAEKAEAKIIEALMNLEKGEDDEGEAPVISQEVATVRQHSTNVLGGKLNGQFTKDLVAILDAGDTMKKGPVQLMDDCIGFDGKPGRWTKEEVLNFPVPGSKLLKADKDKPELANQLYDYYTTTNSAGDRVSSSWFRDIVLATAEGERINAILSELQADQDKAGKDMSVTDAIKLEKKRLTDGAQVLRKGISLAMVIWKLESGCPKLVVEIQREEDGTPLRTLYPVTIGEKGHGGQVINKKAYSLSQVLGLFKPSKFDPKYTCLEMTVAKGGTVAALRDYGMPKKKKGPGAGIKVGSIEDAYNVMFAFNNWLSHGGSAALMRQLNGPSYENYMVQLGELMENINPIWVSGVDDRYTAYNTLAHKKDREALAAKAATKAA